MKRFALCLNNQFGDDFSGDDLIPGWTYEFLGEEKGMFRIIDESGEDYLYPSSAFLLLTAEQSQRLGSAMQHRIAA